GPPSRAAAWWSRFAESSTRRHFLVGSPCRTRRDGCQGAQGGFRSFGVGDGPRRRTSTWVTRGFARGARGRAAKLGTPHRGFDPRVAHGRDVGPGAAVESDQRLSFDSSTDADGAQSFVTRRVARVASLVATSRTIGAQRRQ